MLFEREGHRRERADTPPLGASRTFDQFTYDLTTTNGSTFILVGNTSAVTNTPLGQVKLEGIGFTVPAGLIGLESLATNPTLIRSVDVVGGTPDAILLNIVVGLTNPSNLDLKVGNVTFQLFRGESFLGTAVLPVRFPLSPHSALLSLMGASTGPSPHDRLPRARVRLLLPGQREQRFPRRSQRFRRGRECRLKDLGM